MHVHCIINLTPLYKCVWVTQREKLIYSRCIVAHPSISYSWKYWQELNLAVEPKIAIARIY